VISPRREGSGGSNGGTGTGGGRRFGVTDRVEATVGGDPVEPCPQRRATGETAKTYKVAPGEGFAYHPTALGHEEMAKLIEQALQ
jgi:hypothetical protein